MPVFIRSGSARIIEGTFCLAILTSIATYFLGGFTGLSGGGVTALILGVGLSYALGVGLMIGIFYSSRFHDESVQTAALDHFNRRDEWKTVAMGGERQNSGVAPVEMLSRSWARVIRSSPNFHLLGGF